MNQPLQSRWEVADSFTSMAITPSTGRSTATYCAPASFLLSSSITVTAHTISGLIWPLFGTIGMRYGCFDPREPPFVPAREESARCGFSLPHWRLLGVPKKATYDGISRAKSFAQLREWLKRYARDVPIETDGTPLQTFRDWICPYGNRRYWAIYH